MHKTKNRRGAKIQSNFITIIYETPEKLSLVTLVTSYNIDRFYHLLSDPNENLKNKNQLKTFKLVIVTSNKLYFHNHHKNFKCSAKSHKESNFCHKFYPFTSLGLHGLSVWQCGIDSYIIDGSKSIFRIG